MKTVVIYESMYGNTHRIADEIAEGARTMGEAVVVPVAAATGELMAEADVVLVGAPTHVHTLPSSTSRKGAAEQAGKKGLEMDASAGGAGLRDWLDHLGQVQGTKAAAFDTRLTGSPLVTGRASKAIGKRLRHHGFTMVAEPESFVVDKQNHLVDGEADRARRWAEELVASL